eukprot:jgi/Undpi1/3761/HiC_scaffold_16.g07130.m1
MVGDWIKDVIGDHFAKLSVDDLKEAYLGRAIALDQVMRVSGKHLDGGAGSLARAAEKLEQIAAARGTTSNATLLSSMVLSRLEEAQQLQQLVNISDTAALAESRAHAEQAELN